MPLFYYSSDSLWTYVVIVLPAILLAMWASANVNSTFKKYSKIQSSSGYTGFDAARRILDAVKAQFPYIERAQVQISKLNPPLGGQVYASRVTMNL